MKKAKNEIQTFLGLETTLEGKLAFEGTVRLDGHFTGTIESKEGVIMVGEKAVIHADILVHTVTVSGEVSSVSDDWNDNMFLDPAERFPGCRIFERSTHP